MLHEMTRMVVGSGLRFFLSQPRFGGEECTVVHCIAASLPGRTMPPERVRG